MIKKQNGRNGQANRIRMAQLIMGFFQINSVWISKIAPYGYTKEDLQFNAGKNTEVATWIIVNIPNIKCNRKYY